MDEPNDTVGSNLLAFQNTVNMKIAEAEVHLGVRHGTLADVAHDTDYLSVLKMHATIEPLINELLEENITRVLKHPKVYFPGGDTLAEFVLARNLDEKRKLAVKCELISPHRSEFIRNLANMRNRYAHNIKNISLSIFEMAQKMSPKDNGEVVLKSLYGLGKMPSALGLVYMRPLLHWNFAFLLSEMIKGIKPPVWEGPGGILSATLKSLSVAEDEAVAKHLEDEPQDDDE
jgi:hypothetical protein